MTGLTRSEAGAKLLRGRGQQVLQANLSDGESLARAARAADLVVHATSSEPDVELAAIRVLLDVLASSRDKSFLFASTTALYGSTGGRIADEHYPLDPLSDDQWRIEAEQEVLAAAGEGVRSIVLRSPLVYGRGGGGGSPGW